jgi:hypothetical protein
MNAARNAPPPFRGCKVRPAFQVRFWFLLLSDPYAALGAAALELGLCSLTTTTRDSARRARGCVRASDGSGAGVPWVLGGKNARVCRVSRWPSAAVVQTCHGARRGSVRRALRLDREANGVAPSPLPSRAHTPQPREREACACVVQSPLCARVAFARHFRGRARALHPLPMVRAPLLEATRLALLS